MADTFAAYVTNLGRYNEGELIGEWVDFPTTKDEIKMVFDRIGINDEYEEWFVSDYDDYLGGLELTEWFGEYPNLDELNYFAAKIASLDNYDTKTFLAALEHEQPSDVSEVFDLIDATENQCFCLYLDINDDNELGRYWVEESGCYDTKNLGRLADYIDYEAFGQDIRFETDGEFTQYGWLEVVDSVPENYDGEIPDEYRII